MQVLSLSLHDSLSPEELGAITTADWERNYQNSPFYAVDLKIAVEDWVQSGLPLARFQKALFGWFPRNARLCEFHSINGGGLRDLFEGTRLLLTYLKNHSDFSEAITYYDNPRVAAMARHINFDFKQARPCEGAQRTFSTTFYLKD